MNPALTACGQIHKLAEMNTRQIRALDLQKTVVLFPSYTDGRSLRRELANAIVTRPGWTVVMFPQIPWGNDPADRIGRKTVFAGSYPVRTATLRAVYMDLANELGDQGFPWILLCTITAPRTTTRHSTRLRIISMTSTGGVMVPRRY